jgi:hypothetical protein
MSTAIEGRMGVTAADYQVEYQETPGTNGPVPVIVVHAIDASGYPGPRPNLPSIVLGPKEARSLGYALIVAADRAPQP